MEKRCRIAAEKHRPTARARRARRVVHVVRIKPETALAETSTTQAE